MQTRLQAPDCNERFPTRKALFTGLYRGVGSVVIATLPAAGTFFTTYEASKTALGGIAQGPALHMASSAIAELASCVILTPAEIIKQRAQVARNASEYGGGGSGKPPVQSAAERLRGDVGSGKGVGTAARNATRAAAHDAVENSMAGRVAKDMQATTTTTRAASSSSSRAVAPPLTTTFVRGYVALAARNLPFTAVQFPLYEKFREILSRRWDVELGSDTRSGGVVAAEETSSGDEHKYSSSSASSAPTPPPSAPASSRILMPGLVASTSAACAGSIAALLSTPIDNAKTRIMISQDGATGAATQGTWACMRGMYVNEGWKSLWRGGLLRSVWTALGAGIYLGSYESGRLWWRTRGERGARSERSERRDPREPSDTRHVN